MRNEDRIRLRHMIDAAARATAPDIPWSAIVSIRNRLIHGYFDIDTEIVWKTVTDEIPAPLPSLRALVQEE